MGPPSRYAKYAAASSSALYYSAPWPSTAALNTQVDEADIDNDTDGLSDAEWARFHLAALARAREPAAFEDHAKRVLASRVNVTVNGMHLSRELYSRQWGATFNAKGALVFVGAPVESPAMRIPMHENATLVGLQYDAVFTNADDRLSADSASRSFNVSITSSINLTIAEDKSLPAETPDRRRIFTINQIIVDKTGLITFPIRD